MSIAVKYTKHPSISFRDQLREFVRKNPGSSGAEVRKGIAKSPDAARYIVTDVSVALNDMSEKGILIRDRQKCASFYSINKRRFDRRGRFLEKKGWGETAKKAAQRNYELIRKGVKRMSADIRDDVLAEAYLRISDGIFNGSIEDLLEQSRFHVQKEYRGGWREDHTIDGALTETGFNLLDVLSDEDPNENFVELYRLERRVDTIQKMECNGWEGDQINHLWYTGGTTWFHRSNG